MKHLVFLMGLAACKAKSPAPPERDIDSPKPAVAAQGESALPPAVAPSDSIAPPTSQPAPNPTPVATIPGTHIPMPTVPTFDPLQLGWPAGTRTAEFTAIAEHLWRAPADDAKPIGKIVRGTRVAVRGLHPATKRCSQWVEIAPQGFACATKLKPSQGDPGGEEQPVVARGQLTPGKYFTVIKGAAAYKNADAVRAGTIGHDLTGSFMLKHFGVIDVDDKQFVRSKFGLIPAESTRALSGSLYEGMKLATTPPPSWPFGFAWTSRKGGTINIYTSADAKAAIVGKKARRGIVPVLAETAGYVQIGDGQWIKRANVRVVEKLAPPAEVGPDAQWIDVNLDEQVLVAYRGATPEFVTLVSTGKGKQGSHTATPVGRYRIQSKAALTRMAAEEGESSTYEVSEVPWATRFRSGLFFHAAYWHDGFGEQRSHGCVNMSPKDAQALYRWTEPVVPIGWSEIEAIDQAGPLVQIRDRKNPTPAWFDYSAERPNKPPKKLEPKPESKSVDTAATPPAE